jgi:hypothetical protein
MEGEKETCPICQECAGDNYAALSCSHRICLGCFVGDIRINFARSESYKCPLCRTTISLQEQQQDIKLNVEVLPRGTFVETLATCESLTGTLLLMRGKTKKIDGVNLFDYCQVIYYKKDGVTVKRARSNPLHDQRLKNFAGRLSDSIRVYLESITLNLADIKDMDRNRAEHKKIRDYIASTCLAIPPTPIGKAGRKKYYITLEEDERGNIVGVITKV